VLNQLSFQPGKETLDIENGDWNNTHK